MTASTIPSSVQTEFNDELNALIEQNKKRFKGDIKQLIDFLTASMSYFQDDGMSRQTIREEIAKQVN